MQQSFSFEKLQSCKIRLFAHYSNSLIFVQKFNFDKTPTFSRVFHPIFFLTISLVKSKLSTAKKSKTKHFHDFFTAKKSTIFSRNQSWIFGQKMKISNSVFLDEMWTFGTVYTSTLQMRQFQWFSKILVPFVLKILEHFVKKKSMTSAGTFSLWFMSHTILLSTSVVCKKNNVDLPSCWLLLYRIFCQYGCLLGQQVFFILYVIRWRPREQLVELLYLWLPGLFVREQRPSCNA